MKTIKIVLTHPSYHQTVQTTIDKYSQVIVETLIEEIEEKTQEDKTDQDYMNNILAIINGENGEYFFRQRDLDITVIIEGGD